MQATDLTYTKDGMFTCFMAETPAGIEAWNIMAAQSDGVAKVLNIHADSVIRQLRKAGYVVAKAKQQTVSDEDLLRELSI